MTGTESAMAMPRKQISKDRRLIPARKVPSASNIKSTKLFAGAGTSMIFIMTTKVVQWSACVHINRTRAGRPAVFGQFVRMQTVPIVIAKNSQ